MRRVFPVQNAMTYSQIHKKSRFRMRQNQINLAKKVWKKA